MRREQRAPRGSPTPSGGSTRAPDRAVARRASRSRGSPRAAQRAEPASTGDDVDTEPGHAPASVSQRLRGRARRGRSTSCEAACRCSIEARDARAQRRLEAPQRRLDRLRVLGLEAALERGARGRVDRRRGARAARRGAVRPRRSRASPRARRARRRARPRAAGRPRARGPGRGRGRARSASSSQASATSRPDSSAASRCCGCRSIERDGFGGGQLARRLPVAVGDLLARAVADAGGERLAGADLGHVGVRRREPVAVDRAVEQRERLADRRVAVAHGGLEPRAPRRPRAAGRW